MYLKSGIKIFEDLPNFLRVFREGLPDFWLEGVMVEMCNLSALIAERSIAEGRVEIALNLIAGGILNDEQIAVATGLSVDKVKDLHYSKA